jgi:hypothetical protein
MLTTNGFLRSFLRVTRRKALALGQIINGDWRSTILLMLPILSALSLAWFYLTTYQQTKGGAFDEPHKLNLCAVGTREFEFGRMTFDVAFENVSPRASRNESFAALILAQKVLIELKNI